MRRAARRPVEPERRIDAYLRHLETERRLSPHTLSAYRRDLQSLLRFARRHSIPIEEMDSHAVRRFVAECHRRGGRRRPGRRAPSPLSPRSVARRLSAVRCFYAWLLRSRIIGSNPAVDIQAPKPARRLPSTLDADQMASLLGPGGGGSPRDGTARDGGSGSRRDDMVRDGGGQTVNLGAGANDSGLPSDSTIDERDPLLVRDRAILELFYSSGLRLAELAGLNLVDLDADDRTVRVIGKGDKTRVVPVGRHALEALRVVAPDPRRDGRAGGNGGLRQQAGHAARPQDRAAAGEAMGAAPGRAGRRSPAHAQAFLRQPHARVQRRPARRAGTPRPREHFHNPGVYAP